MTRRWPAYVRPRTAPRRPRGASSGKASKCGRYLARGARRDGFCTRVAGRGPALAARLVAHHLERLGVRHGQVQERRDARREPGVRRARHPGHVRGAARERLLARGVAGHCGKVVCARHPSTRAEEALPPRRGSAPAPAQRRFKVRRRLGRDALALGRRREALEREGLCARVGAAPNYQRTSGSVDKTWHGPHAPELASASARRRVAAQSSPQT